MATHYSPPVYIRVCGIDYASGHSDNVHSRTHNLPDRCFYSFKAVPMNDSNDYPYSNTIMKLPVHCLCIKADLCTH